MGGMMGGGGGGGGGIFDIGVGIAGAAGAFDPKKPDLRNVGKEVGQYINEAQPILSAEQSYLPQYSQLYGSMMRNSMLGSPVSGAVGDPSSPGWTAGTSSPGSNSFSGITGDAAATLGPKLMAAYRASNPANASLMDNMNQTVSGNLAAGPHLDPAMLREVQQNVRAAQSARGMGYGPSDVYQEAMTTGAAGNALQQQRLSNASMMAALNNTTTNNAWQAPASMMGSIFANSNQGTNFATGQFGNPYSPYIQDAANTNLGVNWDYNKTLANIRAQSASQMAQGANSGMSMFM